MTKKGASCNISSSLHSWTIHGLWPQSSHGAHLQDCNNTWVFDENKIKDLIPALTRVWPNMMVYNTPEKYSVFWKHEWDTHGTCCTDFYGTRNEHGYFQTALKLYQRMDIFGILKRGSITPGTKGYKLSQIEAALQSKYKGQFKVTCLYDKGKYYLAEVHICIDKSLSPMICPHRDSAQMKTCKYCCRPDKPIFYLPIRPTQ